MQLKVYDFLCMEPFLILEALWKGRETNSQSVKREIEREREANLLDSL